MNNKYLLINNRKQKITLDGVKIKMDLQDDNNCQGIKKRVQFKTNQRAWEVQKWY